MKATKRWPMTMIHLVTLGSLTVMMMGTPSAAPPLSKARLRDITLDFSWAKNSSRSGLMVRRHHLVPVMGQVMEWRNGPDGKRSSGHLEKRSVPTYETKKHWVPGPRGQQSKGLFLSTTVQKINHVSNKEWIGLGRELSGKRSALFGEVKQLYSTKKSIAQDLASVERQLLNTGSQTHRGSLLKKQRTLLKKDWTSVLKKLNTRLKKL